MLHNLSLMTRHKKSLSSEIEKKPVIWTWICHFCALLLILMEQRRYKQNYVMNILSDWFGIITNAESVSFSQGHWPGPRYNKYSGCCVVSKEQKQRASHGRFYSIFHTKKKKVWAYLKLCFFYHLKGKEDKMAVGGNMWCAHQDHWYLQMLFLTILLSTITSQHRWYLNSSPLHTHISTH